MKPASGTLASAVREQERGLRSCVHCGFCLPACPTYRRLGDEADSPRGRLRLMQAVVEGRLDAGSDAFRTHLGRCLGCRACEPVCPAGVEYGHLLELARQVGGGARSPPILSRLLLRIFGSGWIARPAMFVARLLRASGVPAQVTKVLARRSDGATVGRAGLALAMLAASAPPRESPRAEAARPSGAHQGTGARRRPVGKTRRVVGLLAGCVQSGLFSRVNAATARVLEANGYRVVAVPNQVCCGALHSHGGDLEGARALARRNVEAFDAARVDLIAMNASGCGAAMTAYGTLLAGDPAVSDRARALAERVRDVSRLLADRGPAVGAAVPLRVTYDHPCHLLHAQRVADPPAAVLRSVPGLDLVPLHEAEECCGGAGVYSLLNPVLGGRIRSDKVRYVLETGADALVTANPGCMMQIGAGLALAGSEVPVLHLVEVVDESYRRGGLYERRTR